MQVLLTRCERYCGRGQLGVDEELLLYGLAVGLVFQALIAGRCFLPFYSSQTHMCGWNAMFPCLLKGSKHVEMCLLLVLLVKHRVPMMHYHKIKSCMLCSTKDKLNPAGGFSMMSRTALASFCPSFVFTKVLRILYTMMGFFRCHRCSFRVRGAYIHSHLYFCHPADADSGLSTYGYGRGHRAILWKYCVQRLGSMLFVDMCDLQGHLGSFFQKDHFIFVPFCRVRTQHQPLDGSNRNPKQTFLYSEVCSSNGGPGDKFQVYVKKGGDTNHLFSLTCCSMFLGPKAKKPAVDLSVSAQLYM